MVVLKTSADTDAFLRRVVLLDPPSGDAAPQQGLKNSAEFHSLKHPDGDPSFAKKKK